MLIKYYLSDKIKTMFEDFSLGLRNVWTDLTLCIACSLFFFFPPPCKQSRALFVVGVVVIAESHVLIYINVVCKVYMIKK